MDVARVVKVEQGLCVWSARKYWCMAGYVAIPPSNFCFRTSSLNAVRDQQLKTSNSSLCFCTEHVLYRKHM